MSPEWTTAALWIVWLLSWGLAAFWSSRGQKRGSLGDEIFFRALLFVGSILLFVPSLSLDHRQSGLWPTGNSLKWLLVATTFSGLSFTWWARVHLGRLWSAGRVTTKPGHKVVDTGPYRIVRHPIYSGLILAAFATAIEKESLLALVGAAVIAVAFYTKARNEERFLRSELGEQDYDAYARRTAMLVPGVGRR